MKNMNTYLLASAVLFASSAACAQQAPPPKGPPPEQGQNQGGPQGQPGQPGGQQGEKPNRPEPKEISGTVESFNKSPRGSVDAVIVTADGSKVQINLAPDLAGAVTKNIAVGDTIKATVVPERPMMQGGPGGGQGQQGPKGPPPPQGGQKQGDQKGGDQKAEGNPPPPPQPKGEAATQAAEKPPQPPKPDHEVFHALAITDSKGTTYGSPDGPPKPQTAHSEGKVKSLNYDRQGVVNGFTVDNGDLVLVQPPEAKKLSLKAGDAVKVDGNSLPNNNNSTVIIATNINGTEITPPRPPQQMGNQQQQGGQGQQQGQQRPPMGPQRPGGQGPMGPGGGGGGGQRGPQGAAPMIRGARG